MNVSLNWLKDYLQLDETVDQLSDILTFSGIEVEAIRELKAVPETVITARIVSAEPVPKSDHLHLCRIDVGPYPLDPGLLNQDSLLEVVCGAPNCRSGLTVVLALPGSVLGELEIKTARLRGVVSNGMLCSERELGISEDHSGIIELASDTALGISVNELYALPDTVFELEITPNRSDLLGYMGIARDLSASLNRELKLPAPVFEEQSSEAPLLLRVDEPGLCPRYIARIFDNVTIGESPLWLKTRLLKAGLRPINNIVDITNYVMLCTGNPLHAFDYDKLEKLNPNDSHPSIIVRKAKANETILALDGKTYQLLESDLVIADGQKASAIAGVMGGELTAISTSTRRIVLESADFNPSAIRKTSYRLKLSTDSSYRFERHLSDHAPAYASQMATELIMLLAGGQLTSAALDDWQNPSGNRVLGLRPARVELICGYHFSDQEIRTYLERLGLEFIQYGTFKPGPVNAPDEIFCFHGEQLKAGITEFTEAEDCIHAHYYKIPPQRVDLEREIDLIEELARLAGYGKVPHKTLPSQIMDRHAWKIRQKLEDFFVDRGCFEVLNYSFDDPEQMAKLGFAPDDPIMDMIRLVNPQSSNQSVLRSSLIPGLLANLAYNLNHGERDVRLFEQAKVYRKESGKPVEPRKLCALLTGMDAPEHWSSKAGKLNVFQIKGIVEELLALLGLNELSTAEIRRPYLVENEGLEYLAQGRTLAFCGRIKPVVAERFGIDTLILKQDVWFIELDADALTEATRKQALTYNPIPRSQGVTRDLSFLIPEAVSYETLQTTIKTIDSELIEEARIFDEYRSKHIPEGFKSMSIHLFLRDSTKTLTDERIDLVVDSVIKTLQNSLQITLR